MTRPAIPKLRRARTGDFASARHSKQAEGAGRGGAAR